MNTGKILITGASGFIGFHLANRLIKEGHEVVGLDSINNYYSLDLKYGRLKELGITKADIVKNKLVSRGNFSFIKASLEHKEIINQLFKQEEFDVVINLAAQAGVRYSLKHPDAYINSNIKGFLNILEAARFNTVNHLIYASSSSVYGLNTKMPFSVQQNVDHPVSLYAATKKSNELMAHSYSHLFDIPTTGLRFFTVYGPWGRPDMALFIFTKRMLEGRAIDVNNYGDMARDFTYIDDITESISRLLDKPPTGNKDWSGDNPDPSTAKAPYQLFNIGHNSPIQLMDFIEEIENQLAIEAEKNLRPMQPGDVKATWADVEDLFEYIDYRPQVGIKEGIKEFISWYKEYYNVNEVFGS